METRRKGKEQFVEDYGKKEKKKSWLAG